MLGLVRTVVNPPVPTTVLEVWIVTVGGNRVDYGAAGPDLLAYLVRT